jgi:thiosulfate dehydrogenase
MRIIIAAVLLISLVIGLASAWHSHVRESTLAYNKRAFKHAFVIAQANHLLGFNLVDPEQAPHHIRDSVMRGFRLITNTGFYAPDYAHNELACTNCHFCAGDTLGGKNNGISLVGVTTTYPSFSKRSGKVITLAERINNCFQRSMNGKPIPVNSRMMKDILNYLQWISKEVEHIKDIPWLGLPDLKSKHKPDPREGEKIYDQYCSACHQPNGEGGGMLGKEDGKTIPPLWGPFSFNDGAGMNTMAMLAPFIYLNMPYQQAMLTEEQALDVASFIVLQRRPVFHK